jgi:hypothetical protein
MWVVQAATKTDESTSSPIHLQHSHPSVLLLTFWNRNWDLYARLLGVTGGGCALRGDSYFALEKRHERIDRSGMLENLLQF